MSYRNNTAYLDGLRGWAAVLVYWHHHELWAHQSAINVFERAFGYRERHYFVALPWIRNLFNGGHYATATFFVISGYIISIRPLELLTSEGQLANHLSSAIFRRSLRLYVPAICTTFLYMTAWHVFHFRIRGIRPREKWMDELKAWFGEVMDFSFPFSRVGPLWLSYNDHLWSIPLVLKGSLVNYTTLLALFRSSPKARVYCQFALIAYFMYAVRDGWYLSFFMAGMSLREMDLWLERRQKAELTRSQLNDRIFPFSVLLFSMYLGGVPHCADAACIRKNPGWYYLSFLTPTMDLAYDPKWHYLLPAAVLLLISVKRIQWLKCFFEKSFSQHLGKISYSLYLVHGPVMRIFADTLYATFGWRERGSVMHSWLDGIEDTIPLPVWGPLGMEIAFLAAQLVLLPLTFGLAYFVTWALDRPSNDFSRWIYRQTMPNGREKKTK